MDATSRRVVRIINRRLIVQSNFVRSISSLCVTFYARMTAGNVRELRVFPDTFQWFNLRIKIAEDIFQRVSLLSTVSGVSHFSARRNEREWRGGGQITRDGGGITRRGDASINDPPATNRRTKQETRSGDGGAETGRSVVLIVSYLYINSTRINWEWKCKFAPRWDNRKLSPERKD